MDIDIWVRPDPDNAAKVYQALVKFGVPMNDISASDFSDESIVFQIGVAPRRIDIITQIAGVDYDEASESAGKVEVDNLSVKVLSAEHLIKNKLAVGRPKDIDDVQNLREILSSKSGVKTAHD